MDDDLFPHRTAVFVLQKVDLIEHHEPETVEGLGPRVDHVAQHFCGHDEDRGFGIDAGVTGQQANARLAEETLEVAEFLVREGFDRRRVESPLTTRQRGPDRMFRDEGLAGASWCRDENRRTLVECRACGALERIGGEGHDATRPRRLRRQATA